jgi:hypothetical protein
MSTATAARTETEARAALAQLRRAGFIGQPQGSVIQTLFRGEERQYFFDKICELHQAIQAMPKTYDQDGLGSKAVVHLHYFYRHADWYITEKDVLQNQSQAFGLADLGYGGEMGYISLIEITGLGAELDFHWTPKTLAAVREQSETV